MHGQDCRDLFQIPKDKGYFRCCFAQFSGILLSFVELTCQSVRMGYLSKSVTVLRVICAFYLIAFLK